MPWHITRGAGCPPDKPWAVVKDSSGQVVGCHETEEAAKRQLAALNAQEKKS